MNIKIFDEITQISIDKEVNEWQYWLWYVADRLKQTDLAQSPYFTTYVKHLLSANKELEELQIEDSNVNFEDTKSCIEALEIIQKTNCFYTWINTEISQELLDIEIEMKAISDKYLLLKLAPAKKDLLRLEELVEKQHKLRLELEVKKIKERKESLEIEDKENQNAHVCNGECNCNEEN